jgi:rSAM/selenodomain-associated transferase 2
MSPRFSLIIPTLNEEARLAATLATARVAFGASAEYIVSDGGSQDATVDIAEAAGAVLVQGERGRGAQLQRGVTVARGDVCVFLHADTALPATARSAIERALSEPGAVGGAFSIEFSDDTRLRLLAGAINLRTRVFHTATGDQVIFARRMTLQQIGGVPAVPLFEDVRLCGALKHAGRFVILKERVGTSARLWRELGMVRGVLLHLAFRGLHAFGASPALLARYYPRIRGAVIGAK